MSATEPDYGKMVEEYLATKEGYHFGSDPKRIARHAFALGEQRGRVKGLKEAQYAWSSVGIAFPTWVRTLIAELEAAQEGERSDDAEA